MRFNEYTMIAAAAVLAAILAGCGGGGPTADTASTGGTPAPVADTAPPVVPPVALGSATLSWTAPTNNSDGTPLTDLAGFHIHYGLTSTAMDSLVTVSDPAVLGYVISQLPPATYYFSVTSYTFSNVESVRLAPIAAAIAYSSKKPRADRVSRDTSGAASWRPGIRNTSEPGARAGNQAAHRPPGNHDPCGAQDD
jgi:hypothetical protein